MLAKLENPPCMSQSLVEYLENWCSLLERLINPRNLLDSPHNLPAKRYVTCAHFTPMKFLIHIQKVIQL